MLKTPEHELLTKNLRSFLRSHKIRKGKFALAIGITPDCLYKYETGARTIPKHMKRAIMQYTNDIIHFSEVD